MANKILSQCADPRNNRTYVAKTAARRLPPFYPARDFSTPAGLNYYLRRLNSYIKTQNKEARVLPAESLAESLAAALTELTALAGAVSADPALAREVAGMLHLGRDTSLDWAAVGALLPEAADVARPHLWGQAGFEVSAKVADYLSNEAEIKEALQIILKVGVNLE
jgi:hypothetical protein